MDKINQMRLIGLASLSTQQLTPITRVKDSTLYALLLHKFEKFEKWRNTKKISRQDFEQHLHRSKELVDEYVEAFHEDATFYRCEINYSKIQFDYYIMMKQYSIVFFFYHISKSQLNQI